MRARRTTAMRTLALALAMCLAIGLAWAAPALAGRIRMTIAAEAAPGPEGLAMVLKVANQGDERALALQVQPVYPLGGEASTSKAHLSPGDSHQFNLRWPKPHMESGRHVVIARLDYADPRDYPLSALAYASYTVGPPQPPMLAALADPLELAGSGELRVVVKNPGNKAVAFTAQVFCPREISVSPPDRAKTLPGRGQAELVFNLENFTGQVGARYPVLVLLSALADGKACDQVVAVVADLKARDNLFQRYQPWWLAALCVLGLALIWKQVRGRGKGRDPDGGGTA